jgi:hypothetical protein
MSSDMPAQEAQAVSRRKARRERQFVHDSREVCSPCKSKIRGRIAATPNAHLRFRRFGAREPAARASKRSPEDMLCVPGVWSDEETAKRSWVDSSIGTSRTRKLAVGSTSGVHTCVIHLILNINSGLGTPSPLGGGTGDELDAGHAPTAFATA